MNVLIIGEWSGYAKNLKEGFVALGHKAVILTSGDGFKKIPSYDDDINYNPSYNISLFGKKIRGSKILFSVYYNYLLKRKIDKIKMKFDLIVIINESFVKDSFFKVAISLKQISKLRNNNSCFILSSCGGSISYSMFGNDLRYFSNKGIPPFVLKRNQKEHFDRILSFADYIVSIEYDYTYCIEKYCRKYNFTIPIFSIPLPITIEKEYNPCKITDKIVILHGVIREKSKGSDFIIPALKILQEKYPDKVEVIIDGKMPYEQYIKLLDRCHILLDEANSYSFGVNAALGLMKGKVVFAGNEKESQDLFSDMDIPIINLIPDIDNICYELEKLINNPEQIEIIGNKSRQFAEKHISSPLIAQKYIDIYDIKSANNNLK